MQACVPCSCFFLFQAEDGIRDIGVTGVQTCALPISRREARRAAAEQRRLPAGMECAVERQSAPAARWQIGRASCRERVEISVVAVSLKKNEVKVVICRES